MTDQRPNRPLRIDDPPEYKTPRHQGETIPGVPRNARTPTSERINQVRSDQRNSALGRFANVKWEDPTNPGQPIPPPTPHPKLHERLILKNKEEQSPPDPNLRKFGSQSNFPDPINRERSGVNRDYTSKPNNPPPFVRTQPTQPNPVESKIIQELEKDEPQITAKTTPTAIFDRATEEEYERVNLPSHFVPYDFTSIKMRRFRPFELAKLHRAQREENFTLVVDVMDSVLNQDVRNLTVPDYIFLMYKQRLDSFLQSPFKIPFTSKYGNNYDVVLTDSTLKIIELKMAKDEYQEWKNKGIVAPTVRDWEILQTNDLDDETEWLWQRAQYIYLPLTGDAHQDIFHEKINKLNEGGISLLESIRDYTEKIKHGVVETVTIVDKEFEQQKAIDALRKTSLEIREAAAAMATAGIDAEEFYKRANEYAEEADLIEETVKKGETYQPRGQEVTLSINILHFFPNI